MAKRDTLDHPKTHRLAELLGVPDWAALGLLASFWGWAHKFAKHGALTEASFQSAAYSIRYEPGGEMLKEVLVAAGWVDRRRGRGYLIHDWPDHCEDHVHIALARAIECFADGTLPRITRLSKEEQDRIRALFQSKVVRTGNAQKRTTKPLIKPSHKLPRGNYNTAREKAEGSFSPSVEGRADPDLTGTRTIAELEEIQRQLVKDKVPRSKRPDSMLKASSLLGHGDTR